MEKLKNPKQLITGPSGQKKMVYSVLEFLDLSRTMNVYVENIKE